MVEASGIPTACLTINLQISEQVPAPRAVFVKFPHGASLGVPGDVDGQRAVLRELFWALQRLQRPGEIVKPPYRWRRTEFEPIEASSFQLD